MHAKPYKIEDELAETGFRWHPAADNMPIQNLDDMTAALYKALSTVTVAFSPFDDAVPTLIVGLNDGDHLNDRQWQHFNLVEIFKAAAKEAIELPWTTTNEQFAKIEAALIACQKEVEKAKSSAATHS